MKNDFWRTKKKTKNKKNFRAVIFPSIVLNWFHFEVWPALRGGIWNNITFFVWPDELHSVVLTKSCELCFGLNICLLSFPSLFWLGSDQSFEILLSSPPKYPQNGWYLARPESWCVPNHPFWKGNSYQFKSTKIGEEARTMRHRNDSTTFGTKGKRSNPTLTNWICLFVLVKLDISIFMPMGGDRGGILKREGSKGRA